VFEIGTSLREARLRRQIDIPEAEQSTKIRAKYLRALEDEQFELLPSPTYVKGFLRSYAEYLGLDGQLYVDEYNSRFVAGEERGETPFRAARRRDGLGRERAQAHRRFETGIVLLTLGGIVLVTALVIAAWKFGGSSNPQNIQNLGAKQHKAASKQLVIRAVRGPSALEIHAGSSAGKVLFQGTLEQGRTQAVAARTVWLRVGATQNLHVTLAGHTLRLPHRHRILITGTGIVRPAA
jgi:cytoskeletal protein RodZ